MLEDERNRFFFSAVSLWELAIKSSLGKRGFQVNVQELHTELLKHRYEELRLESRHAFGLQSLKHIHKDPFDRILIAQAMAEDMVLVTSDQMVGRYPGPIILVH
jgi:PIN domain nuclease of toxin-antitoxin system